jgi:hypothetical protein
VSWICALALSLVALASSAAGQQVETPADFTIAFIGDQGLGSDARAVLELIRAEGTDAVLHQGDFDYGDDPAAWDAQINATLGADFPYFASVGNHDDDVFYGAGGYQDFLEARMIRLGIPWDGDLGVQSSLEYEGIFLALVAPGVMSGDRPHDAYLRDEFAANESIWKIASWHKNMRLMQVGGKGDETGWGVYEESRKAGAIVATGHEHSYSRTHLLSSIENQTVASTEDPLVLSADDLATPEDEGRTFVFVSGLGGRSIRDQELDGEWWASIYTSDQDANHGALFGVFNYQGDPRRAYFYFKDIDGKVVDEFFVESALGRDAPTTPACSDEIDNDGDGLADFPNDPGCDDFTDTSERSAALVCDDGRDNDGDGLTDFPEDPDCTSIDDGSEAADPPEPPAPACSDGRDNDGDGLVDFPNDPGCDDVADASERSAALACDDGRDNDGDGLTDFPDDPDCTSAADGSEAADPPEPPAPACSDGIDNDGDGLTDYPDDPWCTSAEGESERPGKSQKPRKKPERPRKGKNK